MPRTVRQREQQAAGNEPQYIEIVNWRRAQPTIPDKDAPWVKLYTSILDHDGFESLDDASRVLIIALWAYAGRSGRYVFPANPGWIRRKIPLLHQDPDFGPLLNATDAYGEPTPFLRIVDKPGIYNVHNDTEKEKRQKKEKRTKSLRTSEQKEKKEKERTSSPGPGPAAKEPEPKREPEPESQRPEAEPYQNAGTDETRREPVSPSNPKESEDGGAVCVPTPKPPHLAMPHDPRRLGKIPIWWSDPACTAFSYAVFSALGLRLDPESSAGKAERGTFAAWLFDARSKTPVHDWSALEEHALAKAREIARYGKSARRPGAVWRSIMDKATPPRAGPGVVAG